MTARKPTPVRACAVCGRAFPGFERLPDDACPHYENGQYLITCSEPCRAKWGLRRNPAFVDVSAENARAADPRRIGETMRAIRESRGLTAANVAARIGIARANYCRSEAGRHQQAVWVVERFCSAMDMRLSEFFRHVSSSERSADDLTCSADSKLGEFVL